MHLLVHAVLENHVTQYQEHALMNVYLDTGVLIVLLGAIAWELKTATDWATVPMDVL